MPAKKSISENFTTGAADQQNKHRATKAKAQEEKNQAESQYQEAAERKARILRKTFPSYYEDVAPLLEVLENLPQKNGEEFFIRADLSAGRKIGNLTLPKSIDIWVLYTSDTGGAPASQGISTHSLYMTKKGDKSIQPETAHLALNGRPVLHLQLDAENGKIQISSHFYQESYSYAPSSRRSGTYRGDYRQNLDEYNHETHKSIRDFVRAIGAWVSEAAPERLDDIQRALTPVSTALTAPVQARKPLKICLTKPNPPGA